MCEHIIVFGISMCFPVSNWPLCHKLCTVSVCWCGSKTFRMERAAVNHSQVSATILQMTQAKGEWVTLEPMQTLELSASKNGLHLRWYHTKRK